MSCLRDEGPDVGMVEDVVEALLQIGDGALIRRQHREHAGRRRVVEQRLGSLVVEGIHGNHGRGGVDVGAPVGLSAGGGRGVRPARENLGELPDGGLSVSGNPVPAGIELRGAVRVQPYRADAEQLQNFAPIILVGQHGAIAALPLALLAMLRYSPMAGLRVTS